MPNGRKTPTLGTAAQLGERVAALKEKAGALTTPAQMEERFAALRQAPSQPGTQPTGYQPFTSPISSYTQDPFSQAREGARLAERLQFFSPGAGVNVQIPTVAEPPQAAVNLLRQIAGTDPYAGMHQAMEDVIRQMTGAYSARGSQAGTTARQAGLGMGLTPLESAGAAEEAMLTNIRDYYSMLPQMRMQQAQFPVMRQEQLAGLLPLLMQIYGQPGPQVGIDMQPQPQAQPAFAATQPQQMGADVTRPTAFAEVGRSSPGAQQHYQRMAEMRERALGQGGGGAQFGYMGTGGQLPSTLASYGPIGGGTQRQISAAPISGLHGLGEPWPGAAPAAAPTPAVAAAAPAQGPGTAGSEEAFLQLLESALGGGI